MKRVGYWLLILGLTVVLGCGGGSDKYKLVDVTGTVTLDGETVEGAAVTFMPQSAEGVAAAGTTDANGEFTLQTAGASKRGAVAGDYGITVIKQVHTEVQPAGKAPPKGNMPVMSPSVTTESTNVLPLKYANPAQSELKATVSEAGPNSFDFKLESK